MKRVFMFPGQGSQYIGMGKEFYETSPIAKEIFDKASEAVELDLKALCFEENDDINITEYTQVALLTTSVWYICTAFVSGRRCEDNGTFSSGVLVHPRCRTD